MNPNQFFIQACLDCAEWDSVTQDVPLALTVHRYPDNEFWIMPHQPKPGFLGRIVNTEYDLRRALEGKAYVGKPITVTPINP